MQGYQSRKFAIGAEEFLCCEMRLIERAETILVVLREEKNRVMRGVLTARFENIANLVKLEMVLRGKKKKAIRFFQEYWGFDNGKVRRPSIVQEVRLGAHNGQYRYAQWIPVDIVTDRLLSEASYFQTEERNSP